MLQENALLEEQVTGQQLRVQRLQRQIEAATYYVHTQGQEKAAR